MCIFQFVSNTTHPYWTVPQEPWTEWGHQPDFILKEISPELDPKPFWPLTSASGTSLWLYQEVRLHLYRGDGSPVLTSRLLPWRREWVLWVGTRPEKGWHGPPLVSLEVMLWLSTCVLQVTDPCSFVCLACEDSRRKPSANKSKSKRLSNHCCFSDFSLS